MDDREWLGKKVESISDAALRAACEKVIADDVFFLAPAAAAKHQEWTGGLARHTRQVMDIALWMSSAECLVEALSQNPIKSADVIIAGSLWHDFGKKWDYKRNPLFVPEITPVSRLGFHGRPIRRADGSPGAGDQPEWVYDRHRWTIRHLSRSYAEFFKAATEAGCSDEVIEQVGHCILAHHGRNEHGSPVTPLSPEASIVHYADGMSAFHADRPHVFRAPKPEDWKAPR